jgi:hypothetical protein
MSAEVVSDGFSGNDRVVILYAQLSGIVLDQPHHVSRSGA